MDTNFIIIIFTVAVSIYVIYNPEYKSRLLHYPYNVNKNKEYYRLISNGFIHADYIHLFFNMFTFYFFGGMVEDLFTAKFGMWGDTIFILFYIFMLSVYSVMLITNENGPWMNMYWFV